MMNEQEFREHAIGCLATIESSTNSIEEHLKTLNGSVLRHQQEIDRLSREILSDKADARDVMNKHIISCPLRDSWSSISKEINQTREAMAADSTQIKINTRIVYTLVGATIVLFLLHANEVLKFMKIG